MQVSVIKTCSKWSLNGNYFKRKCLELPTIVMMVWFKCVQCPQKFMCWEKPEPIVVQLGTCGKEGLRWCN